MASSSIAIDVYKTKIKDIYITPMKNLSTKHTHSFCWTEFGQLSVELNGKRRTVLGEQVFCGVCLQNAKNKDEDVIFSKAQVKAHSKNIATSNLLRHLKDAHGLEGDVQTTKKSNITEFFKPRTQKASGSGSKQSSSKKNDKWLLSRDLALWFARSLMPFDTVENDAMIDFFKKYSIIVSDADLPSRQNIAREGLEDVYNSMLAYITAFISKQSPRFGALTADMWSDKYRRRNYITCTYHFISEDMTLIKFTLATKDVTKKHTGETIRDEILEMLQSFKIEHKEMYLVTDAGGNMKRAANLLGFDNHLCLGHALHNLINVDGIGKTTEISRVLNKCKKIVKHVRYRAPRVEAAASAIQQELLSSIEEFAEYLDLEDGDDSTDSEPETCETLERASSSRRHSMPPPTIKTSTSTRWHSVLMMLQSISNYANRQPINTILNEIGRGELVLQDMEYETIEDLIKFLENFKKIVEVLSSENQPTMNLAVLFRSEIKRLLEEVGDDEPLVIARLKNNMLVGLESRFPLTDVVVAATLLDCRFHAIKEIDQYMQTKEITKVSFLSSMVRSRLATEDICQNQNFDSTEAGPSTSASSSNFLLDLARKHSTSQRDCESAVENECWKYFSTACPEDLEPYGGDVLQYWKDRRTSMPSLYTLARSILNIPATSTPSERVFSTAGLVITAKRSRLNPLRLNRIVFIHDNYQFCKEALDK